MVGSAKVAEEVNTVKYLEYFGPCTSFLSSNSPFMEMMPVRGVSNEGDLAKLLDIMKTTCSCPGSSCHEKIRRFVDSLPADVDNAFLRYMGVYQ